MQSSLGKIRDKLGRKIQKLRKEQGITQEAFAEKLGISRTHVGHVEQGRKSPSLKLLIKIARAFKVSINTLLP